MNKQDLTLLTDLYELTMMQGYYKKGQHETVVFDVRDLTRSLTTLRTCISPTKMWTTYEVFTFLMMIFFSI